MVNYFKGKIWKFRDDIDTDVIAPQIRGGKTIQDQIAACMQAVKPGFGAMVKPGDVIVAGKNFGCGSSREYAATHLTALGIPVVVAKSFGRIFFRNAINNGILLIENSQIQDFCEENDVLEVEVNNLIRVNGKGFPIQRLPDNILEILETNGLVGYMRKKNGLPWKGDDEACHTH